MRPSQGAFLGYMLIRVGKMYFPADFLTHIRWLRCNALQVPPLQSGDKLFRTGRYLLTSNIVKQGKNCRVKSGKDKAKRRPSALQWNAVAFAMESHCLCIGKATAFQCKADALMAWCRQTISFFVVEKREAMKKTPANMPFFEIIALSLNR